MTPADDMADRRLLRIAARAKANSASEYRVRYRAAAALTPLRPKKGAGEEQRRHDRHELDRACVCIRRIGGFNFLVQLRDVSLGGCGIELIEPYEVGDEVIARFKKLDPFGARVCWTGRSAAGIEFHRAIHPAVFENLLGRLIAA